MSKPDPADVLVASASDRIALAVMRSDAAAALELVRELHDLRSDVTIALRTEARGGAPSPVPARGRPMPAKYVGRCARCNGPINVGTPIYYDRATRETSHARCS